jgi:predicted DNA-binding mobile mystery protein A
MHAKTNAIARQRLDQRMAAFKPESRFAAPPKGWIRAIRDALGMTRGQLGVRLGVKPQSIADLEKSEALGTIRMESLRRVAEALDCTVIYALAPKSTLEGMVEARAREIAREALARVGHTMDLEAQGLSPADREARIDDYIGQHVRDRDLWDQS